MKGNRTCVRTNGLGRFKDVDASVGPSDRQRYWAFCVTAPEIERMGVVSWAKNSFSPVHPFLNLNVYRETATAATDGRQCLCNVNVYRGKVTFVDGTAGVAPVMDAVTLDFVSGIVEYALLDCERDHRTANGDPAYARWAREQVTALDAALHAPRHTDASDASDAAWGDRAMHVTRHVVVAVRKAKSKAFEALRKSAAEAREHRRSLALWLAYKT